MLDPSDVKIIFRDWTLYVSNEGHHAKVLTLNKKANILSDSQRGRSLDFIGAQLGTDKI